MDEEPEFDEEEEATAAEGEEVMADDSYAGDEDTVQVSHTGLTTSCQLSFGFVLFGGFVSLIRFGSGLGIGVGEGG